MTFWEVRLATRNNRLHFCVWSIYPFPGFLHKMQKTVLT